MALLAGSILFAVTVAGAAPLALGAKRPFAASVVLAGLLLATLSLMLLLRDDVRNLALRQAGLEPPAWVVTQWEPFAAFVVCLIGASAAIAWMARALARGRAADVG